MIKKGVDDFAFDDHSLFKIIYRLKNIFQDIFEPQRTPI